MVIYAIIHPCPSRLEPRGLTGRAWGIDPLAISPAASEDALRPRLPEEMKETVNRCPRQLLAESPRSDPNAGGMGG